MDKLQWFKFMPTDWVMGKIQRCPEVTQARFIRLICLYWNKKCILNYSDAEIEIDKEHLEILIAKKIVKIENDFLIIDFLNEQLYGIAETSKKRREAVLKRWSNVKQNDTSVLQMNKSVLQNDTDKSRVDKSREDKDKSRVVNKFTAPTISEVQTYFIENGFNKELAIRAFNYYEVGNWTDSKGNKVKNWKQKMRGVWFKEENKEIGKPKFNPFSGPIA
jgi:hypothetical protein